MASTEKSVPELRLEYLMLREKARQEKQLKLTDPSSDFSLGLDLTDLFDRYLKVSFSCSLCDSGVMVVDSLLLVCVCVWFGKKHIPVSPSMSTGTSIGAHCPTLRHGE